MFKIEIRPDDGTPFQVETTSRDIVSWERGARKGEKRSVGSLMDDLTMGAITDLAWYAANRRGLTDLDIRQWAVSVDIDFSRTDEDGDDEEVGEEEVGPTRTDR